MLAKAGIWDRGGIRSVTVSVLSIHGNVYRAQKGGWASQVTRTMLLWRTAASMVATSQEDHSYEEEFVRHMSGWDSPQYRGTSYLSVPVSQSLPIHRISNPHGFFLVHEEMERDPNRRWRLTRDGWKCRCWTDLSLQLSKSEGKLNKTFQTSSTNTKMYHQAQLQCFPSTLSGGGKGLH